MLQGSGIEFRPYVPSADPPRTDEQEMSPAQMAQILWLIEQVGRSVDLDQTLNAVYEHVGPLLACNRIGLALLDDSGEEVVSRWVRSDRPVRLRVGFTGDLRGTTLQRVMEQREVRIIDDLAGYLQHSPNSVSTRLLVEEGMRSSLTCPLLVRDEPVGFLFFTSDTENAYSNAALPFYQHVAAQLSLVIERARLYSDLAAYTQAIKRHNEQMNHELDLARHVQRMLVPASPPRVQGLDLALWYQPVMQVGGDLVELAPLPDGSLLIFVADAMGHGVQAALVMSVLKGMLTSLVTSAPSVDVLMQQLNLSLQPLLQEYFAVALCIHIEPQTGRLRMARAGVPPPLLYRHQSRAVNDLSSGGLPLAIAEDGYPVEETTLEAGDLLIVATDGLEESLNENEEQFGMPRLRHAIAQCGHLPAQPAVDCILAERQRFCGRREQADDMTLLAVRRL